VTVTDTSFEEDRAPAGRSETLNLVIDGWEGPLDLLLMLARTQKVDLREISILALTEQYLAFIEDAKALRLEIAADYLVMAAWLAYLKSCLLLPREAEVDPDPEELALRLQMRLQRLDAMRDAGARLMARNRLGRDVFPRGSPEGLKIVRQPQWIDGLFELIGAYGAIRARSEPVVHMVAQRAVLTLDQALARLEHMLSAGIGWRELEQFLPDTPDQEYRRSALASSFLASLELARTGRAEISQEEIFGPLFLRAASR
jgi:segregation and condensation protein A